MIIAAAVIWPDRPARDGRTRDGDFCRADTGGMTGSVIVPFDLTKPLAAMDRVLPGRLLVDIGRSLQADNELRVFGLCVSELAPRTLLGRLCKPYDGDEPETVSALGERDRWRECDDVSAGHANGLREAASGFCEKLLALERELDERASRAWVPEERLGAA